MTKYSTRPSAGGLILGGAVVLVGLVVLGNTVLATTLSLTFLGWLLLVGGVVTLAGAVFLVGKQDFWVGALGGGLMTVLGLVLLRHTSAAAVTLTLVAGAMFLASGCARLVAAFHSSEDRLALLVSGGVSTILGLIVLFNIATASEHLLGLILGVEIVADGIAIMLVGRELPAAVGHSRGSTPEVTLP
jgi:uncharacterized membrane protein HdeD (DUF308 family)